jgi:hypothetical protein
MQGISWLAAKTGQLLKKDSAPWSKQVSYLKTNSDLRHLRHKQIGFYNRDEKCLQRGTD